MIGRSETYRGNCGVKDYRGPSCWGLAPLSQRCLPTHEHSVSVFKSTQIATKKDSF